MIRLGIVGPGRITARVMADMDNAKEIRVTAVASRDPERARAAAEKYHIPVCYGSYAEMAESREVDLVYIATPHPFHMEQAMMMMRRGKHVICEKPMAVNDRQTARMIECARANGVFLMEAMWTRFMPAFVKAGQLADSGAIGKIRHIEADFSYSGTYTPGDRVYALELAGGALLDLGVYPLMGITRFLGWEPVRMTAFADKVPTGADMRMSAQMLFESGATAQFFCGMDAASGQTMTLYGTEGYIRIPRFWCPNRVELYPRGQAERVFEFPAEHEGHHYEFDHAARCIEAGLTASPVVTPEESLAVSRICTKLRWETGVLYPMDNFPGGETYAE